MQPCRGGTSQHVVASPPLANSGVAQVCPHACWRAECFGTPSPAPRAKRASPVRSHVMQRHEDAFICVQLPRCSPRGMLAAV